MRNLTDTGKQQFGWFGVRRRPAPSAAAISAQIADAAATGTTPDDAAAAPVQRPLFQRFLAYLGIYILDKRPQRPPKWHAKYWSDAEERQRIRDGHPIPYWMMDSD
ncbi:MAG TPA: hypothetical protein VMW18_13870 [Candidatus Binatia bacterium]|nr:hypothetical protein [Candidatus Binatia bacterium]